MTDARITMRHIRQLGFCASGAREWCKRHGIDMRQLAREGVPVSKAEATGDEFGIRAAELARKEAGQ